MQALQSLTDLFRVHVTTPQNLVVWAEDGELICTQGDMVDGYELIYTVNIDMSAVAVQPHVLMMHLINWLNTYDIDRQEKRLPPPTFATQILEGGLCDLKIKLDIRESMSFDASDHGNWQVGETRYACVSEFGAVVDPSELEQLKYIASEDVCS